MNHVDNNFLLICIYFFIQDPTSQLGNNFYYNLFTRLLQKLLYTKYILVQLPPDENPDKTVMRIMIVIMIIIIIIKGNQILYG